MVFTLLIFYTPENIRKHLADVTSGMKWVTEWTNASHILCNNSLTHTYNQFLFHVMEKCQLSE